jgi:phage-related protein
MAGENIGFRIPANYLEPFGYPTHPQIDVAPNKGLTSTTTSPLVDFSSFAASQRTPIGINPSKLEFSVGFLNVDAEEASYIQAFFEVNKGVIPFSFYLPYTASYRTSGGNTGTTTLAIFESPLYDIYPDAIITADSNIAITAGTKVVQVDSPTSLIISNSDFIPESTPIRITNVKKEFEVVCTEWNFTALYLDLYSISATFKLVYSAKQRYTPTEGDIL